MSRNLSTWRSTGRRIGKRLGRKSPARRRTNFVRPVELGVERLEPRWVLAAGALDTTFDPVDLDGVLIGNLGAVATANVRFTAVTTQADGKILAAGTLDALSNNEQDFLVARFNANGSLDTTFGVDGPDAGATPDGFINFDFSFPSGQNFVEDITLDSTGRIIVVGSGPNAINFNSWTIARLTSSGQLDSSFNGTGKVVTSWTGLAGPVGAAAHGVAVQSDGKIVVVGDVRNLSFISDLDWGIARYNNDGTLDSTFGSGGKIVRDFFARADQANDVAIQADGKIVVGGYAATGTVRSDNFALARYDSSGNLDSTFGSGGMVNTDVVTSAFTSQDRINSVKIQGDGRIVVTGFSLSRAGQFSADENDFVVARYLASGSLDTTYDPVPPGALPSVPGTRRIDYGFRTDIGEAVALQVDGKCVIAGSTNALNAHNDNDSFSLARTDAVGALDSTFGSGGQVTTRISDYVPGTIGYAFLTDMALQPDGKIVATGYVQAPDGREKFVIARYESGLVTQTIAGAADINEGQTYTLTLSSSDPTTTQWTINWGDGTQVVPGNPASVTHVYADGNAGYTISATVTTATGTTPATNTVSVAVQNVAPTLVINGAADVNEGSPYTLNLSSSDPGADIISQWTINWGDGTEVVTGNPSIATHTYADGNASYSITATATDEDGTFTAALAVAVAVHNVAPTLAISGASDVDEGSSYALNLSASADPGTDTITQWTINWGDGTQVVTGNPSSVSHTYADGTVTYTISATATDEDGTFPAGNTVGVTVHNLAPTANDATYTLAENSPNGTAVGAVTATDAGTDTLSFSIVGGPGAAAFAIDSATGQITVANSLLLDFETTPTFTLDVEVSDGEGGLATASVTIDLVNLASISGVVFVDVNQNGLFDANEPGIDGVVVKLLDQNGNAVLDEFGQPITETTSSGGLYLFDDLNPGIYQLFEMQPTGVTDGGEYLGSLGGTVVANDRMQLTLAGADAFDYAFSEIGQQITSGDAATIGFWQNKNGQALIVQGGTQLAAWLTSNFSNIFGNTLVGVTGSDVATFYREQLFKQQSKKSAGPAKVDAQFMAVALATYFTNQTLAGVVATSYGFHVTTTGIGTKIVNVGTSGAAFNVTNGSDLTIMQLLLATNSLTDQPDAFLGFSAIYDTDGNGVISSAEAGLRTMANSLFTFINESGGV